MSHHNKDVFLLLFLLNYFSSTISFASILSSNWNVAVIWAKTLHLGLDNIKRRPRGWGVVGGGAHLSTTRDEPAWNADGCSSECNRNPSSKNKFIL